MMTANGRVGASKWARLAGGKKSKKLANVVGGRADCCTNSSFLICLRMLKRRHASARKRYEWRRGRNANDSKLQRRNNYTSQSQMSMYTSHNTYKYHIKVCIQACVFRFSKESITTMYNSNFHVREQTVSFVVVVAVSFTVSFQTSKRSCL